MKKQITNRSWQAFFRHTLPSFGRAGTGFFAILFLLMPLCARSQNAAAGVRETRLINNGWRFALGDASSMERDFTHGTEYFTYLSKAASTGQNRGPAAPTFDDSRWQQVSLPHDWVVDLPFSARASHSHGYKQVGWGWPQNSVGWYRHRFFIPKSDEGRRIAVRFDGIFRNAQVFCNGFYLGHEPSGYASATYNLTEYLNYGGDNVLTVRADASTEEGWYYEGAGIYRDVWLEKTGPVSIASATYDTETGADTATVSCQVKVGIDRTLATWTGPLRVRLDLLDARDAVCATAEETLCESAGDLSVSLAKPHWWSADTPYLYKARLSLYQDGRLADRTVTRLGLRSVAFDPSRGMTVNGQVVELKGTNLHLDHAGVGVGVPDSLWVYRVKALKALGSNAIRCSHNPATPAMLDICDSLGMYVIDENRLMGTNREHRDLLERMISRDRHHPSVILWSIGNEEWLIESSGKGEKIARTMQQWVHDLDPSRPVTYGNSGGDRLVTVPDIHGYNYIVQNDVDNRRRQHPDWFVIGTEETSGCGTRNVYFTDSLRGWMRSINYEGEERSGGERNVIERGWKFYKQHPWAGGLFYWTGFDYRGEPNPMKWPATGSQFGLLDYCGFPKDEAFYLKAAWTPGPVLHLLPHWNLRGHEGDSVEVWAYSNCTEVELLQDGHSLGRKPMPADGHLSWSTVYRPGRLLARGYRDGRLLLTTLVETTGPASRLSARPHKRTLRRDGQDIVVVDLSLLDSRGRLVPDACDSLQFAVSGPAEILGCGNGDPGFKGVERPRPLPAGAAGPSSARRFVFPAFMGRAQVILRSREGSGPVVFTARLRGGRAVEVRL